MKNKLTRLAGVTLIAGMTVVGAGAQTQTPAPAKPGATTTHHATTHPAATTVHRSLLNPASLNQKAPDVYKAKFTTTKGDFVVEVTRAWSPIGADRFYNLVKNGFFTDVEFFRVVPGFVVQFGISGNPKIATVWSNANIADDPVMQSNKRGFITFAKTGAPNSRATQVFINLGDSTFLDSQGFSPFGQVTEGLDVVEKFDSEYGDNPTPHQDEITTQGNAYLKKTFPKLDSIKTAAIIFPAPATAPAAKKPAGTSTTAKPAAAKPKPPASTPPSQ